MVHREAPKLIEPFCYFGSFPQLSVSTLAIGAERKLHFIHRATSLSVSNRKIEVFRCWDACESMNANELHLTTPRYFFNLPS